MLILDALKALCQKVTGEAATKTDIGDVIQEIADNYPENGGVANATTSTAGIVKQAANVPAAVGDTPTKAEFDALLTALQNAGIMADS